MATFEATQGMRNQQHFEILEWDLPVITGACTLGASQGTGTPRTCDQPWAGEYKTYYFTNENAPILPSINGEPIYRLIKSIKETATELKPGDGLSSRSSLSIVLSDIKSQDPNVGAPGVTDTVKKQGTYLGKLSERQIFENKNARLKLYRVEPDGSIDLVNGAQTRSFLLDTLSLNKNGTWTAAHKDLLSLVNLDEKTWPITKGGFLRQDVDNATLDFPVDEFVDWSLAEVVRIGDEHLRVTVTGNLTNNAELHVLLRGADVIATVSGELLTKTEKDDHSAGDEVFICDVSDDETIDDLYTRVLVESDFPVGLIPSIDWADEVNEWHASDKINTLHNSSESVNDVINRLLTGFLMDSWYSVTDSEAKLSAISVWKESTAVLIEGREINAHSIKKIAKEPLRATRSLILYDKRNLSDSDDASSFKKGAQFSDPTLISPALFVKHKDKSFDNNHLLNKDAADLLTQRYVSRFKFTPFERTWITDERYLTFKTGDVVDLATTVDQNIYGLPSGNIRAQITKINPKYKGGRTYEVKALTYEAAFDSGTEIVLDSPLGSVNLYILAGAPSQAIEIIFILDGSYSFGNTAISAGSFPAGSKIVIILVNGFDGQAKGGNGGNGEGVEWDSETSQLLLTPPQNGFNGGIVYDAQGVHTDIYFSGATPSAAYPMADGYIRAPSGGDGGFEHTGSGLSAVSGNGGDGSDGRPPGIGGSPGSFGGGVTSQGLSGSNGEINGTGTGWGIAGDNNFAVGGLAGSGIIDSGATVTLFADGDLATRYINGAGSHP